MRVLALLGTQANQPPPCFVHPRSLTDFLSQFHKRYEPPDYDAPTFDGQVTVASSSKFLFSNFSYVLLAAALCQTHGLFREPVYKNVLLSALLFVELATAVLLTVVDWPIFDHWFQLRGAELTVDYRRQLLGLGLANGCCFILYERFVIPHRSLDEDPVTARPPGAIVTDAGSGAGDGAEGKAAADADGDGLSDAAHPSRLPSRWWPGQCLNGRANGLLPKLGHRAPLYQKGTLAFG